MGIDLEALANELRAAGCFIVDDKHGQLTWVRDSVGGFATNLGNVTVNVCQQPDVFAIIARHLGAGQLVAADRAHVPTEKELDAIASCMLIAEDKGEVGEQVFVRIVGDYLGRVDPPAPLSAEEDGEIHARLNGVIDWGDDMSAEAVDDMHEIIIERVLAALPERYAVRREGA